MASYPGAIYPVPSFGTNMSDVKTHTTWRDEITDEVRAVEIALGTNLSALDTRFINVTGDTMTGLLGLAPSSGNVCARLRETGEGPVIDFWNNALATRFGFVQCSSTVMTLLSDAGAIAFKPAAAEVARFSGTALWMNKTASNLATTGMEFNTTTGSVRSTTSTTTIQNFHARHESVANADGEKFYDCSAAGTVIGAISSLGTTGISLDAPSTGDLRLRAVTGDVILNSANAEHFRLAGTILLGGKTATALGTAGHEMPTTGSAIGSYRSTTNAAAVQNVYCRHESSAAATGEDWIQFLHTSTIIGSIDQNGTTATNYNTTSDERLKTVLRELDDDEIALILRTIAPVVFEFNSDPGTQYVGFIAQQLARQWPTFLDVGIVTRGRGEPGDIEEIDDDGNVVRPGFKPWMIDLSKLTPLLVAGWQQLDRRLSALEAA